MEIITKISMNLSTKLGDRLGKNKDEKEILNYGLFVVIHTSIGIILTILTGIVIGVTIEMLIISITSGWFKRYTGGVHATTPERCLVIGLILSLTLSLLCKYIVSNININYIIILGIFIIIIFYYIINKKCPVPSKNKPLKKESTRKKLRKKALALLNGYLTLLIILYAIYILININVIKIVIVSCVLGIALQMIVLTEKGKSFINILDKSFNIFKNK